MTDEHMDSSMTDEQIDAAILQAIERRAAELAEDWVENSKSLPKLENHDWIPFLTALALNGRTVDSPPDEKRPGDDIFQDARPADHAFIEDESKIPVKDPASGSWNWIYYVPPWTHPNYSDRVVAQYDGETHLRETADPLRRLRPAMLASDVLRNPTPYAKRFGIHPDEIGGRSCLSPSISDTRNPLEDYSTQVALLNDTERTHAIKKTHRRGIFNPTEPNYIDPNLLDEMYEQDGIHTGARLKAHLASTLEDDWNKGDWSGMDGIFERLQDLDPAVVNANRNFFDRVRREQDWQRVIFGGLTTDELVQNKIHTVTGTDFSNLNGPLHR